ncbi:MAG TPA: cytochrome c oxidase subunit II [Candidatus Binataceae bacterium]|nr:cytochrome c oxidase subunit II [Candidatus Binataceae bacterium]
MLTGLLPANASTFGGDIDHVFWLIFWIVGFWFVLAEGVLAYSLVRYRKGSSKRAAYLRGDSVRQLAWVLVPAAIILCLDLGIDRAGASAWDRIKGGIPPAATTVRITAKQFNWNFTYPGPDGKFGTADDVTVENDLHVPAGKVVRFELRSEDVIHSFFVPEFRLKQDVVPGRTIAGWFQADKPGTYEIACSELCGFGHYSMHGNVVVQSAKDYEAWSHDSWTPKTASNKSNADSD